MMKQEALFKKLGNILNELNEQYQFLAQNPAQLSELELELFLANANFLADHVQIIKKLNLPLHVALQIENKINIDAVATTENVNQEDIAVFADHIKKEEELPVGLIPHEDILNEAPTPDLTEGVAFELEEETSQTFEFILNTSEYDEDDKFDFEEKNADELFDRSLTPEEESILAQKKQKSVAEEAEVEEEDEIGPEPFLVRHEEPAKEQSPLTRPAVEATPAPEVTKVTIETSKVEIETEYQPTLNDILSQKNSGARVNETSGAALSDLKAAINLNDKLLYIKDLFNGYSLAYAEAIDIANKMADFNAADNFLQKNYAMKNNWAANQATVDKFYILLNRRFKS